MKVYNQNDNQPEFTQDMYVFTLSEDTLGGTLIGRIQATDKDGGLDPIFYFTYSPLIRVDERSGDFFLVSSLDYELGLTTDCFLLFW